MKLQYHADLQQKKVIFSEKRAKIAKSAPPLSWGGQSIFSKLQFFIKNGNFKVLLT